MLNELLLLSKSDIPFESAKLIIHQPSIKEISYIGEEVFYTGCDFLKFSKNKLTLEDKTRLEHLTNFDILIAMMGSKDPMMQRNKAYAFLVLSLLFPQYDITIQNNELYFKNTQNEQLSILNKDNFDEFQKILTEMFCLQVDKENTQEYNPIGSLSAQIAEKFNKRHQKLQEQKGGQNNKIAILSRYVSILAVGERKDINQLLEYSVFQLFDEFTRFELKSSYDVYLKAKLAGATELKEVEDWMKDIHP